MKALKKAMKGWFKVSENILGDPKLVQCSGPAQLAFLYGLAYCARHRTDGVIGEQALPQICQGFPAADITTIAKTLITFGLWETHPTGYTVKNYLAWQRSRDQIDADLLLEIGLAHVTQFPVVRRIGGPFSPKITRIVLRTTEGGLLLVALKGSVGDAAAKILADQIADALWRTPPRTTIMLPDPSHYIGPHNRDGLGASLPQPNYAVRVFKRRRFDRPASLT